MYTPGYDDVPIPMVTPYGVWAPHGTVTTGNPASTAWESANRAVYHPVIIPCTVVAKRLWWANGSTVSASYNLDVGLYRDAGYRPGAKIISSGSTAQGTASTIQFVDITDTALAPGIVWLALSCSSTSATVFRTSFSVVARTLHIKYQEASAVPLPTTATPAEAASTAVWHFGFSTTTIT